MALAIAGSTTCVRLRSPAARHDRNSACGSPCDGLSGGPATARNAAALVSSAATERFTAPTIALDLRFICSSFSFRRKHGLIQRYPHAGEFFLAKQNFSSHAECAREPVLSTLRAARSRRFSLPLATHNPRL